MEGDDAVEQQPLLFVFSFNSMPDLSVPEIVKQFNERQSQKSKQRRRPHSSAIYSTKNTTRKQNSEKPSEHSYNAFITGKNNVNVFL